MENGITNLKSPHSVSNTINRLTKIAEAKGLMIFARINQQAAAVQVGLEMRPTELLLFGNPQAGTALMNDVPSIAIDLPLKALAWEDRDGQVWLSYNSLSYLQQRHSLTDEQTQKIAGIVNLAEAAVAFD